MFDENKYIYIYMFDENKYIYIYVWWKQIYIWLNHSNILIYYHVGVLLFNIFWNLWHFVQDYLINKKLKRTALIINQHIGMISEWLCDTEDWCKGSWIYIYIWRALFQNAINAKFKKKWVCHAILLCTEPIHCSINVSCQIARFPCLKCTARCSSFPNRYKRRTCFLPKCDISSRSIRIRSMQSNMTTLWSVCLCSVFKMSALNSNNTFDGLDEPVRSTPGGRKRRLDKENHKK